MLLSIFKKLILKKIMLQKITEKSLIISFCSLLTQRVIMIGTLFNSSALL